MGVAHTTYATEAPDEHTTVYLVVSVAHPGVGGGHDDPTGPPDRVYAPAAGGHTPPDGHRPPDQPVVLQHADPRRHPAARRELVRGRGRLEAHLSRTVHDGKSSRGGIACHDESLPRPGHPGPPRPGCRRRATVSAGPRRSAPHADPRRSGVHGHCLLSPRAPRRGLLHRALQDGCQPRRRPRAGRGA